MVAPSEEKRVKIAPYQIARVIARFSRRSIRIQKCQEFLPLTVKIHTLRDQNNTLVKVGFASGCPIVLSGIVEM